MVGILGSRTAIQRDRTKEGPEWSFLKFNTGKFKILHLGWNDPEQQCKLAYVCLESSFAEKGVGC